LERVIGRLGEGKWKIRGGKRKIRREIREDSARKKGRFGEG